MGVMHIENNLYFPIQDKKLEVVLGDINDIQNNFIYRTDEIYKECSYPFKPQQKGNLKNSVKSVASKIPKPLRKANKIEHSVKQGVPQEKYNKPDCDTSANKIKDVKQSTQQAFSKVYKSPIRLTPKVEAIIKKPNIVIEPLESTDLSFLFAEIDLDRKQELPEGIRHKNNTISTSTTKFRKPLPAKKRCFVKTFLPRFVCPCCTGGDAVEEPYQKYQSESARGSFETIDLRTTSSAVFPALHDASLMSIINLHRTTQSNKIPAVNSVNANLMQRFVKRSYKNLSLCLNFYKEHVSKEYVNN